MSPLKSIFLGVALLVVIVGAALIARNRSGVSTATPTPTPTATPTASTAPSPLTTIKNNMHEITISTNLGDITFQTYDADAPKTVENFVSLANKKFYEDVIFHRVISGFMIQGGDPTGTGTGGPGYKFDDELTPGTESALRGYTTGTVAMANAGPNTNGSQFFIMHRDYPLPHNYTIFGHVVVGQDVVDKIATTKTDGNDKPLTPVVIKSVSVKDLSQ